MHRFFGLLLLASLYSCTILGDSDVKSENEFIDLHPVSLTLIQQLQTGQLNQHAFAASTPVEIAIPSGGVVTREVTFTLPEVKPDWKLKFRSGVTGSEIKIRCRYLNTGKIYSIAVFSGSNESESYTFEYNNKGQPNKLTTTLQLDGLLIQTTDQITYDTYNRPGDIIRSSPNPNLAGTFILSSATNKPCENNFNFSFREQEFVMCEDVTLHHFPSDESISMYFIENRLLQEVSLINGYTSNDVACCSDTFYFHPVLLVASDPRLQILYAKDWWLPSGGQPGATNEQRLTIRITYGK